MLPSQFESSTLTVKNIETVGLFNFKPLYVLSKEHFKIVTRCAENNSFKVSGGLCWDTSPLNLKVGQDLRANFQNVQDLEDVFVHG